MLLFPAAIYAQTSLQYHARVGKPSGDLAAALHVLEGYLNSDPGSPSSFEKYWSKVDQKDFPEETDLSRNSLFQFDPPALLAYFQPLVLKAEKTAGHFEVQVMFHHPPDSNASPPSSPFAILTYCLVQEGAQWKLSNAIRFRTAHWHEKRIGNITFHYPHSHTFNETLAKQSERFCHSTTQLLSQQVPEVNYYVCSSGDELGYLLGFDFFFAGYTTGKAFPESNLLLSGLGSEYYPHELAHLCLPGAKFKFIDEGLATYFGGTLNLSYSGLKKQQMSSLGKFSMEKLAECFDYPNRTESYFVGALLVEFAIDNRGMKVVPALQNIAAGDAETFLSDLRKVLDMTEDAFFSEFSQFLRDR